MPTLQVLKTKEFYMQMLRFGFSGGAGVIAGFITLYVLTEFFSVWYIFSAIVAGIVNGGINFFLEKYWTFKNNDKDTIYKQAGFYTVLRLALFGSDVGLLYVFVEYLHINYLVSSIIIGIFLSLISFLCCRVIFLRK